MKFDDLVDLNEYINENPEGLVAVDIDNLEVSYSRTYSLSGGPSKDDHNCYIMFKNEEAYNKYLEMDDKIDYTLSGIHAVNTYISLEKFTELRGNPGVKYIEIADEDAVEIPEVMDTKVTINGEEYEDTPNWGARLSYLTNYWNEGYTGEGVNVLVIDTVFKTDIDGLDFTELIDDTQPGAESTHGTRVAGVIGSALNNKSVMGNAYGCNLYAYATGIEGGMLSGRAIDRGLNWAIVRGNIDVINMSFGNYRKTTTTRGALLDRLYAMGTTLVAAAGNDVEPGDIHAPSEHDKVICVAGLQRRGTNMEVVTRYGGYEPSAQLFGPGILVESIADSGNIIRPSGTSFASPWVAGLFAILKQKYPNASTEYLYNKIRENGKSFEGSPAIYPMYWSDNILAQKNIEGNIEDIIKAQLNVGGRLVDVKEIQGNVGGEIVSLYKR